MHSLPWWASRNHMKILLSDRMIFATTEAPEQENAPSPVSVFAQSASEWISTRGAGAAGPVGRREKIFLLCTHTMGRKDDSLE